MVVVAFIKPPLILKSNTVNLLKNLLNFLHHRRPAEEVAKKYKPSALIQNVLI
jgi:hypothetical protein